MKSNKAHGDRNNNKINSFDGDVDDQVEEGLQDATKRSSVMGDSDNDDNEDYNLKPYHHHSHFHDINNPCSICCTCSISNHKQISKCLLFGLFVMFLSAGVTLICLYSGGDDEEDDNDNDTVSIRRRSTGIVLVALSIVFGFGWSIMMLEDEDNIDTAKKEEGNCTLKWISEFVHIVQSILALILLFIGGMALLLGGFVLLPFAVNGNEFLTSIAPQEVWYVLSITPILALFTGITLLFYCYGCPTPTGGASGGGGGGSGVSGGYIP